MEAVGLVLGLAFSLADLLQKCLGALQEFETLGDNEKEDSSTDSLDLRIRAQRHRLEKWGQAVGLEIKKLSESGDQHQHLQDPEIGMMIEELLRAIGRCCFGRDNSAQLSASSSLRRRLESKQQTSNSALKNSTTRIIQVEQIERLVQQLYDLVPPDGSKGRRPTHELNGVFRLGGNDDDRMLTDYRQDRKQDGRQRRRRDTRWPRTKRSVCYCASGTSKEEWQRY